MNNIADNILLPEVTNKERKSTQTKTNVGTGSSNTDERELITEQETIVLKKELDNDEKNCYFNATPTIETYHSTKAQCLHPDASFTALNSVRLLAENRSKNIKKVSSKVIDLHKSNPEHLEEAFTEELVNESNSFFDDLNRKISPSCRLSSLVDINDIDPAFLPPDPNYFSLNNEKNRTSNLDLVHHPIKSDNMSHTNKFIDDVDISVDVSKKIDSHEQLNSSKDAALKYVENAKYGFNSKQAIENSVAYKLLNSPLLSENVSQLASHIDLSAKLSRKFSITNNEVIDQKLDVISVYKEAMERKAGVQAFFWRMHQSRCASVRVCILPLVFMPGALDCDQFLRKNPFLFKESNYSIPLDSIRTVPALNNIIGDFSLFNAYLTSEYRSTALYRQLMSTIKEYDFGQLTRKVDNWRKNSNDETSSYFKLLRNLADTVSELQWEQYNTIAFEHDVTKYFSCELESIFQSLCSLQEVMDSFDKEFVLIKEQILEETAKIKSFNELSLHYERINFCFELLLSEASNRLSKLRECIDLSVQEGEQLVKIIKKENQLIEKHNQRYDRVRYIIHSLNAYLDNCRIAELWNGTKLDINVEDGILTCEFPTNYSIYKTNPMALLDSSIWLIDNAQQLASTTCSLRNQILSHMKSNLLFLDYFILTLPKWSLKFSIKPSKHYKYLAFGSFVLSHNSIDVLIAQINSLKSITTVDNALNISYHQMTSDDEAVTNVGVYCQNKNDQPDNKKSIDKLIINPASDEREDDINNTKSFESIVCNQYCNILLNLCHPLIDILAGFFNTMQQVNNLVDVFIGVSFMLLSNISALAIELLSIQLQYNPHRSLDECSFSTPDLKQSSSSVKIHMSNEHLWLIIPVSVSNRLETITLMFKMVDIIKSGKLCSGLIQIMHENKVILNTLDSQALVSDTCLNNETFSKIEVSHNHCEKTIENLIQRINPLINRTSMSF